MSKKLLKLAIRRDALVLETEKQRMQLAQIVDTWRAPCALVDQGLAVISFIRKHPIWIAGASTVASTVGSAVLVKLLRKSFIGKWFSRGMIAWQLVHKIRSKFFA
jgi:YqjK-like protein